MFKVIIAGGRNFDDYNLLRTKIDLYLSKKRPSEIEIVSGGARGADALGERFAKENSFKLTVMSADWDTFGKSAGYIRNVEMAKYADACVCFWDGKSRGTKNMIEVAQREGLLLKVVRY